MSTCKHCGDPLYAHPANEGGVTWWSHAARDGSPGKSRCQHTVAYGHLAEPEDQPCRAGGPNPCLGAKS